MKSNDSSTWSIRSSPECLASPGSCAANCVPALLLVALLLLTVRLAHAIEPTIPVPRGYVSDYAGVLPAPVVQRLDELIAELKAKTGAEIAVVVVDSTEPLSAFDYAMKVAEAWKPGAAGKDNGVVFLVAVQDRRMFILTGYGVEGALPDGRVGEIRDRIVRPAFKRGDYATGVEAGTAELAATIAAGEGVQLTGGPPTTQRRGTPSISPATLFVLALVLIIVLFMVAQAAGPGVYGPQVYRRRRYPGGFPGGFAGGFGGGLGGGRGGGFGGFGGGSFGGGGAGGDW
jgi:uncharacterized protein